MSGEICPKMEITMQLINKLITQLINLRITSAIQRVFSHNYTLQPYKKDH